MWLVIHLVGFYFRPKTFSEHNAANIFSGLLHYVIEWTQKRSQKSSVDDGVDIHSLWTLQRVCRDFRSDS